MNLFKSIFIYMLFSLIGVTLLYVSFELAVITFFLHLFIVSGVAAGLIFFISLARARWIIAVVFTLILCMQFLLYVANVALLKLNRLMVDKDVLLLVYNNVGSFFTTDNSYWYVSYIALVVVLLILFFLSLWLTRIFYWQ